MKRRSRRAATAGILVLAAVSLVTVPQDRSLACGFHNDVTLARGMLNWAYPDALHVVGAMAAAVVEERLPQASAESGPDPFGARYRALVVMLNRLKDELGAAAPPRSAISLVLVEPMLWTRFQSDDGELRAQVHAGAPRPGDLVVVSGGKVVQALVDRRFSIAEAHRLGLLRLYGADDEQARFLATYGDIGSERRNAQADLSQHTIQ